MPQPNLDEVFRGVDVNGKGLSKNDLSDDRLQVLLQAQASMIERIYVGTYEEAEPYFTGDVPREVYVASDEAYYEGESSWYKYDPRVGTGLLGIDFNYKEN